MRRCGGLIPSDSDDDSMLTEDSPRASLLTSINWTQDDGQSKASTGPPNSRRCRSQSDRMSTAGAMRSRMVPSTRLALAALCSFGCVIVYSTRVSMSIALVCMVNQTAVAERARQRHGVHSMSSATGDMVNCPSQIIHNGTGSHGLTGGDAGSSPSEDGPFVWEEEMQGIVLSSFFWGYIVTQLPAGILADRIGGKWIWGVCLGLTCLLTMSVPLAAQVSVYLVILVRVLCGLAQGVTFPTLNSIMANWFPQQERSFLMNIATTGCSIGTIVTYPASAFLCKSSEGWEAIFYLFGGLGLIWLCLWSTCMGDTPSEHEWISCEEKAYIEQNTKCNRNGINTRRRIPWRALVTSPAFLSLCTIHFTGGFKFFMLLTQLPTFVRVILDFDLAEVTYQDNDRPNGRLRKVNGLINVMPILVAMPAAILASIAADYIKNTGRFRVTSVRKAFAFLGSAASAAGLIAVPLAGCNRQLVLALVWSSIAFDALNAGGLDPVVVDMAPNIAGTTTGISNSFAAAGGILAPYIVGILTQNNNAKRGWDAAFYLSASISLFGLLVFMIFGSAETQPWNESQSDDGNDQLLNHEQLQEHN